MKSPKGRTVEGESGAMPVEDRGAETSRAKRKEEGNPKESRNRYIDYALEESTELPAPLPLAPADPIRQQPRGPGAYPHRGVDYRGSSHLFTSLEFGGEDNVHPTPEEELEEGLVTAKPVTLPTETAEPMMSLPNQQDKEQEVSKKRTNLHIYIPLGLCALLLLVVGVSIAASTGGKDNSTQKDTIKEENNSSIDLASTEPPEWEWDLPVDIPRSTISIIGTDPDGSTPQSKAYRWMKADPFLHEYSSERLLQRFAMAAFYYATNGANWTHQGGGEEIVTIAINSDKPGGNLLLVNITGSQPWLSYEHSECQWLSAAEARSGATACNNSQEILDHLVVYKNNLQGYLMDDLGDTLQSLKTLDLAGNSIGGTIPTSIGRLTHLEELSFHRNSFSGSVPTELGSLSKLWRLAILESQLTGSIPPEVWQLSGMLELKISANKALWGTLPSDLGVSMPKLQLFQSARNQMSGSLPSSIGLMKNLTSISLHDNRMTGRLPSELGLADKLKKFYAPNNLFSGTLPAAWSRSMKTLNLQGNMGLTGTVPVEWAAMQVLKLEGTSIAGTIAEEVCAMRKLSFDCSPTLCGCDCPCLNTTGGP